MAAGLAVDQPRQKRQLFIDFLAAMTVLVDVPPDADVFPECGAAVPRRYTSGV
ncbi:hypothetical protein ACFQZZ_00550 [Nocardia sp. GCM10030253]|uniref:hypothetical protein n=1 Tax=Nocardia sp. GCM10030253 TaxID=3273404 RepID=UPI00363B8729